MTIEEVYQYFGSGNEACKALGIQRQNFTVWIKKGYIPLIQQLRIEKLTHKKLKASENHAIKTERVIVESVPNFRYFTKKHGMCPVETITILEGMKPKITYRINSPRKRKASTFNAKFLMQAVDFRDKNKKLVFEGDILALEDNTKYCFHDITQLKELMAFKSFAIIGHMYDGIKYELE